MCICIDIYAHMYENILFLIRVHLQYKLYLIKMHILHELKLDISIDLYQE